MVKQIKRFSPHQTAKVFALLMAIGSFPMLVPMILMTMLASPAHDAQGNPMTFPTLMLVIFPVFYLVFGYIFVFIGCWLYNFMFKFIGGFEIEVADQGGA